MSGLSCVLGRDDPRRLASPDIWGPERIVRGHVLGQLLLHAGTTRSPTLRQVRIQGARVVGTVNLSHAEIRVAVRIEQCHFDSNWSLEFARTRSFRFGTCILSSVKARGILVEGNLRFKTSEVKGSVSLIDATVSQSVRFSGSTIDGDDGLALMADRLKVGGNVFLNKSKTKRKHPGKAQVFSATGEVRLLGSRIDGQLNCIGGRFRNPGEVALIASSALIGGNVFLSDGFNAIGQVRLLSVRVGGQLNCRGGRFRNPKGTALNVSSAEIDRGVFFHDGFSATGSVKLVGTQITGRLNCSGGRFKNPGKTALSADRSEIRGGIRMAAGFHATGAVSIRDAQIGGKLNCAGGRFDNPEGTALDIQTAKVNTLLLRDLDPGTTGQIDLVGAKASILGDDALLSVGPVVSLRLDGFTYQQIAPKSPQSVSTRLQWLKRQPEGYHPQPFDQLANVFRSNGRDQEAVKVLIEKRRERRKTLQGWWSNRWDAFLDCSVRYGSQAWRPLVPGFGFFLFVFGLAMAAQAMGLVLGPSDMTSSYHPFIHALDVLLPIIDLGLESRWAIDTASGGWFAWLVRVFLWVLPVVGWVTVTLALAALTGLVKRD